MITKIENGIVTVSPLEEFTAEDMLEERRILAIYRQAHVGSNQEELRALDDQIARLIGSKCRKNKP